MLEDFLLLFAQWEKNLHRQTPRSSDLPSSQADGREMGTLLLEHFVVKSGQNNLGKQFPSSYLHWTAL